MQFTKAVRKKAKLRLALTGPSGSGKTLSALLLAKGIGGTIAVIDTENESVSLYATPIRSDKGGMIEPPAFDSLSLTPPYTPERFIEAVKIAHKSGYSTIIIDSITHEWSGSGGCLELVDELARARFKGNTWSAWSEVTPRHRSFIDTLQHIDMHVICTMRSKTETAQQDNNGKKQVVRLGIKSEQRDGSEYEFTIVLDLSHDGHFATASKDRTGLFMGADPLIIDEQTGKRLLEWLDSGEEAKPLDEATLLAYETRLEACPTPANVRELWQQIEREIQRANDGVAWTRLNQYAKKQYGLKKETR